MKVMKKYQVNEEILNEISFFGIDKKSFDEYLSKLKTKISKFLENVKKEGVETKEAFNKLIKSIKTGTPLNKVEKEEIGNQLKDVLKLSGFVAASILPGGFIYLLLTKVPSLKTYMVPSAFLESIMSYEEFVNETLSAKDITQDK